MTRSASPGPNWQFSASDPSLKNNSYYNNRRPRTEGASGSLSNNNYYANNFKLFLDLQTLPIDLNFFQLNDLLREHPYSNSITQFYYTRDGSGLVLNFSNFDNAHTFLSCYFNNILDNAHLRPTYSKRNKFFLRNRAHEQQCQVTIPTTPTHYDQRQQEPTMTRKPTFYEERQQMPPVRETQSYYSKKRRPNFIPPPPSLLRPVTTTRAIQTTNSKCTSLKSCTTQTTNEITSTSTQTTSHKTNKIISAGTQTPDLPPNKTFSRLTQTSNKTCSTSTQASNLATNTTDQLTQTYDTSKTTADAATHTALVFEDKTLSDLKAIIDFYHKNDHHKYSKRLYHHLLRTVLDLSVTVLNALTNDNIPVNSFRDIAHAIPYHIFKDPTTPEAILLKHVKDYKDQIPKISLPHHMRHLLHLQLCYFDDMTMERT